MNPSTLDKILEAARHAPSSHNTQPWTVTPYDGGLYVGYDPSRQLLVGDPHKRELFISLGCFIESICLAALQLGWNARYYYTNISPERIADISFSKAPEEPMDDWIKLLQERRSDRSHYLEKKIPAETIKSLAGLGNSQATLRFYEKSNAIDFLSTATFDATMNIMSKKAFRNELASWVRNNWTKQSDGMPAYTQGMPGPVSLLAKFFIKNIPAVPKDQAKKDAARVKHSSHIGIITVAKEDNEQFIQAGMLYQRTCLSALSRGVKTSAVCAAVIYQPTALKITKYLKLGAYPVILLRFGYSGATPKSSPRRTIGQLSV